jgi:hypothetical protein
LEKSGWALWAINAPAKEIPDEPHTSEVLAMWPPKSPSENATGETLRPVTSVGIPMDVARV